MWPGTPQARGMCWLIAIVVLQSLEQACITGTPGASCVSCNTLYAFLDLSTFSHKKCSMQHARQTEGVCDKNVLLLTLGQC